MLTKSYLATQDNAGMDRPCVSSLGQQRTTCNYLAMILLEFIVIGK